MGIPAEWIVPDWPAPPSVGALATVRSGGVSQEPYSSLNLGDYVGDEPARVAGNRAILRAHLPAEPCWLRQVHGRVVATADDGNAGNQEADASVARKPGVVCGILSADCLPVLFCDEAGTVVAAAHAGWRGLAAGVLEAAVRAMGVAPETLLVWLGPAIGPDHFEVGDEVRAAFIARQPQAATAFRARGDKWLADLYLLARLRLASLGTTRVFGGNFCTYGDAGRFFSYRRDGRTGRMASLVWLRGSP
jgi:hypothetical protein